MKTAPRSRPPKAPPVAKPETLAPRANSAERTDVKTARKRTTLAPTGTAKKAPVLAPDVPWVVRKSPIQGRGVFAARRLRKGERILEYTGERIGHFEAGRRYDDEAMERHHTFLFAVDADTCIDGGKTGNEARYINHACEPNCEARNVRKRIFIHALRTIEAGEELSYDYAYELEGPITMADVTRYPCACGGASCRGTLLAPKLVVEALAHEEARKKARAERAAARKKMAAKAPAGPSPKLPKRPAAKKGPEAPLGGKTTRLSTGVKRREAPARGRG